MKKRIFLLFMVFIMLCSLHFNIFALDADTISKNDNEQDVSVQEDESPYTFLISQGFTDKFLQGFTDDYILR